MAPGLPPAMDRPHFIGIGGAGMSGIAKILAQRGAQVAGSDAKESETAAALRALGVTVHIGHAAEHLADDATCVVVSSRDPRRQPGAGPRAPSAASRWSTARTRSPALMDGLRPIAVAGTHGKTTTTSMLAVVPDRAGPEPVVRDRRRPGRARLQRPARRGRDLRRRGGRERPQLPQVRPRGRDRPQRRTRPPRQLRLDGRDLRVLRDLRREDRARRHPGGHRRPRGRPRADPARREGVRVVTYGEAEDADVRVLSVVPQGLKSEVTVVLDGRRAHLHRLRARPPLRAQRRRRAGGGRRPGRPGRASWPRPSPRTPGVKRRLQLKGEAAGVQVIDSYAHHPTEMTADLEAMRAAVGDGRILVVFQPHLFSRTQELGTEMGQALALADASRRPGHLPGPRGPDPRRDQRADHRRGAGGGRRRDGRRTTRTTVPEP